MTAIVSLPTDPVRKWSIDEAHASKLYSPSDISFDAEWSPLSERPDFFSRPVEKAESHLDFSSEDEDEIRVDPFMTDDREESMSESSDHDSDAMSFVLRESARALLEDIELHDPVGHYDTFWSSHFDITCLESLDEQLRTDPRSCWKAVCWRDAAPDATDEVIIDDPEEGTLRPHTKALLVATAFARPRERSASHGRAQSPTTPGDPILSATPPLMRTPKSPLPPLPFPAVPTTIPSPPEAPPAVDIHNPARDTVVPSYRPITMSLPPPYTPSETGGTNDNASIQPFLVCSHLI